MLEIVIIADDLTGAADTGVQFCSHFTDTVLVSHDDISGDFLGHFDPALQVLAVYTNSRSMKPEDARRRLRRVAHKLLAFEPRRIYKKVDSCLRGNLGAEVDAVIEEMGYELSFIAPAFPEMGRTTVHDTHLVHGTPVAQTELSRDPVTPVTESRLSRVVAAQSSYKVGHVDVQVLEDVDDAMAGEIGRLVDSGVRHVVFDATAHPHLQKIVRMALAFPKKILPVGSAGLAEGLASRLPKRQSIDQEKGPPFPVGHHLLVCGTASGRTREQVSTLLKTYPYEVISLVPRLLADPGERDKLLMRANSAQRILSKSDTIIQIDTREMEGVGGGQKPWPWSAEDIVGGMGLFVASVLKATKPASLFLTGGDTSHAVLGTIGAKGIRLLGEVVPGMVRGTIIGGLADGLPVVTKAGAFGKEDTLVALHEYWMKRMKENPDGAR